MLIVVLATILILAIAFFQVNQGLYSALIMTILTIACALLAFNYYEPLAATLYGRMPDYADGACLMVLFVIPLLIIRELFDRYLGGNVVMGVWADRIGGGVLGLVAGTVLVGVLLVAVQMFPFPAAILGYAPYDATLKRSAHLEPFRPDEFVLGMVGTLSGGSMRSENNFAGAHREMLLDLFCARNDAGLYGRKTTKPDSAAVLSVTDVTEQNPPWTADVPANDRLDASQSVKTLVVRTSIDENAREERTWIILPATHFRLSDKAGNSYYPIGYLTYGMINQNNKPAGSKWAFHGPEVVEGVLQRTKLAVSREWVSGETTIVVAWIYRVPADAELEMLTFRHLAKAAVPKIGKGTLDTVKALTRIVNTQ
ncbi:MAG TPA: hypothetical protein DCX07_06165 [Phycisphaerales bacterium]|nr:hypothetical protein [Phycisphaerales bacterium]